MKTISGILVAILSVLTISVPLSAQQSTFAKVFYDNYGGAHAYSIIRSSDNNFMIAGEKDYAALLIKMDTNGAILWDKKYGGSVIDRFNAITETNDSCFVMAGFHIDTDNIQYILCVKVNQQGDTIWAKKIEHSYYGTALSIQQTNDNGFILAGLTSQNGGLSTAMIVDKLDTDGNLSWSKTFVNGYHPHHNNAYTVKQTPDNGYIVAGIFESYVPPESQAALIKLTPLGTVSWAFIYTSYLVDHSCINDVVIKDDGLLFSVLTDFGIVLMKTDFSGNVIWSKRGPVYDFTGGESPMPKLLITNDNGYAFINYEHLIKTDSAGNFLWSQELLLHSSDAIETGDRGFITLGNGPRQGIEMTETPNPQIGIIKTDSMGNSTACVMQVSVFTDTITSILYDVAVLTTISGTLTEVTLNISSAGLSADSGCVAVIGGVRETAPESNTLVVYPNPSNGMIRIKTDQKSDGDVKSVRIYNGTGECIYQSSNPSSFHSPIDITSSPDGIYYIQVVSRDTVCSQVFTITH